MTPVQVAALVAAWLAAARWSILSASATAATAAAGADPWTLHDPDFPVRVVVTPFADELWQASVAQATDATLAIPSSVLNITVELPPIANVTSTQVSVALFGRPDPTREQQMPSGEAGSKTAEQANDNGHDVAAVLIADTQMQYAKSYRLDVGAAPQRMVMRVYVESQLASGRTMRAMFVRPLDLSPSAPFLPECPRVREAEVALRLTSFPPPNMPPDLCSAYTMDGRVPVRKWYFDDQSDTERTYEERSFEFIEELVAAAKEHKRYYYGPTDEFLYRALAKYPIRGQHVLIVGSTIPWYEAICVAAEAASCTTIDYNRLRYNHPKLQTYTVGDFESSAPRTQFDAIFSISSFEHDGLGRYGEPLDPDADLQAMRALLKYSKPSASADDATKVFLAVPVGADTVVWNAQRIYGPLRLPLLLQEWSLVDSFGFSKADFTAPFTVDHQPLFVLEPKAAEPDTTETGEHSEL